MWTIIIFALIGMILAILNFDRYDDFVDKFFGTVFGSLFGMAAGLIATLIVTLTADVETETRILHTHQLEVLNDGESLTGSFFLGTGSINGTMKFVYYYGDGTSYRLNQVNYEYAAVIYSDETPKVEKTKEVVREDQFIKHFIFFYRNPQYNFYVPKGSIQSNYNLDAQ